jgi:hypothetical protein
MRTKSCAAALGALGALALSAGAAHANLLTNGGFEADNGGCATPPGWTQIGHPDCSFTYALIQGSFPAFGTHEGLRLYSIGGPGNNGFANLGDGLSQSFATLVGASYRVSYGYNSENVNGAPTSTLRVQAGSAFNDHVLAPSGNGTFARPWNTATLDFVANSATTTLSLFLAASSGGVIGNNDPLLDGISVVMTAVPEPAPAALWLAGSVGLWLSAGRRRWQPCAAGTKALPPPR